MKPSICRSIKTTIKVLICSSAFTFLGCKKLIEVEAPVTNINAANVYTTDATAVAVLNSIYARISSVNITGGSLASLSLFPSLSADELTLFNTTNVNFFRYYTNSLTPFGNGTDYWNVIYPLIFSTNAAIEGLTNSKNLTAEVKQQLLGEAKFLRAFCYFYLVNLYGDVPLVLSTDFEENRLLRRADKKLVYDQIKKDLKEAQVQLNSNYLGSDAKKISVERIVPSRWAATALLARVNLFTEDWTGAETEASAVISHSSLYDTVHLNKVFLKNNKEAIWQLQSVTTGINTWEAVLFVLPAAGPNLSNYPVYLSTFVVNSFEPGDLRKSNWIGSITVVPSNTTFYYPNKYKAAFNASVTSAAALTEYNTVLRIAEQYLIRAEARAQLGNLNGAKSDLNVIRARAGLPNTTANDKSSLLSSILKERRVEFFTEWGHRWLDLKRTKTVDMVMASITVQKGGTWNSHWALYPIPQYELDKNPNLAGQQNPGY